jgi:hypothetical protein
MQAAENLVVCGVVIDDDSKWLPKGEEKVLLK